MEGQLFSTAMAAKDKNGNTEMITALIRAMSQDEAAGKALRLIKRMLTVDKGYTQYTVVASLPGVVIDDPSIAVLTP